MKKNITLLLILLIAFDVNSQNSKLDVNLDGEINILVLGSSNSIISSQKTFFTDYIAIELDSILSNDTLIKLNTNVVYEEISKAKNISTGIASSYLWNVNHYCHSLAQYYYWPDKRAERLSNLRGNEGFDWDYVVIGSDPVILKTMPGYYSFGVNKIVSAIYEGGAVPLLLMQWDEDLSLTSHFEEFTYRAAVGAPVPLEVVPAGLAWEALPNTLKDVSIYTPSPNGDYIGAASIYSHLLKRSASYSKYIINNQIADVANEVRIAAENNSHYTGKPTFNSPFRECSVNTTDLVYNHSGSSTENGILNGLNWVTNEYGKTLQYGSTNSIHFNYGRSSMGGGSKEYNIDNSKFDYSFGYALQDDARTGYTSMLYGLDKRNTFDGYDTDLGTALKMVNNNEIPYARNVPLRTIIAQMVDEIPGIELYPPGDNWHLSSDVNKAIASYMHTMLSGECTLPPASSICSDSAAWRTWMAHKIGQETAWTLMYLEGENNCNKTVDNQSTCAPYTWVNGVTYTKPVSGIVHTYTNSSGCDSVVMLNLSFESLKTNIMISNDTLISSITGETYKWIDCVTNSIISEATQKYFVPNENGNYAVIVTNNGCSDTSSCFSFLSVGINTLNPTSNYYIFPNPNHGDFKIDLGKVHQEIEVTINNSTGQKIYRKNFSSTDEIDISVLNKRGVYFLNVKTEIEYQTFKILVN
ncbi:MAG: T9SS type A sorting domain-containing protein [Flavobacteriales bacterium]|nr:T9SS type A sorting domain-containing protein [Flavobacteriales bacterium]